MAKKTPMEIIYWEVGVNLRTDAGWNRRHVEKLAKKHRLEDNQCIILFNNSSMFGGSGSQPPKCRIYWKQGGQVMTVIPPTDDSSQVDFQLQLNDWMRKTFGSSIANTRLDEVMLEFDARYETRKVRMEAAQEAARALKASRGLTGD